jgi:phospholipid/cholesterol/gamma-HCH transport system ATP-binding protein
MIKLVDIHKSFDGQVVLDGLNLEVPEGKITAIIGPSGGGKSVLLKHVIGLLRPDRGQVLVDGEDISRMGRRDLNRVREKFGMLFQNAALFDSMTVFENVAFPLEEKTRLSRAQIQERVHEALEQVGLRNVDHKYPDELSGGMKKRVGLARALLLTPRNILFDEPTTGLDPIICKAIHRLIRDTYDRFGYTAVILTHELPAIFDICHYVAMLFEGKILAEGTPDEIRSSPDPRVQQFIKGELEGPLQFI